MTLLKGYCPTCNGPLWRDVPHDPWTACVIMGGPDAGCRLCWMDAVASGARCFDRQPFEWNTDDRDERWEGDGYARWAADNDRRDEWRGASRPANSTENTAATSKDLPQGCTGHVSNTAHADAHNHARRFWTPSFGAPPNDVEYVPPKH